MEDFKDLEIENLKQQNKHLKELWNLMAEELDVCNLVIGMSMSDAEFYERRKEAWRILKESEEEE